MTLPGPTRPARLLGMSSPILLAVPNVAEGRDRASIETIAKAFEAAAPDRARVRLLDLHADPDHHRSVFTLAGPVTELADAVLNGAAATVRCVDVVARAGGEQAQRGQHPHVGALDVAPVVYLDASARGAACAEALVIADRIGSELQVPVFLYGELAGGRTRAQLRRGGVLALAERMASSTGSAGATGSLVPDFGPPRIHPSAGATLVAAREPLVAFNLELAPPASLQDARAIAASIREGAEHGLPSVRAIGVALGHGAAQVSTNIERPLEVPLALVVDAVSRHARVGGAELVGLAPRAALEGFPEDVPLRGFDPARHVIENALRS